jgi:hypothetical protein
MKLECVVLVIKEKIGTFSSSYLKEYNVVGSNNLLATNLIIVSPKEIFGDLFA